MLRPGLLGDYKFHVEANPRRRYFSNPSSTPVGLRPGTPDPQPPEVILKLWHASRQKQVSIRGPASPFPNPLARCLIIQYANGIMQFSYSCATVTP